MATEIDSLVVALKADLTSLQTGMAAGLQSVSDTAGKIEAALTASNTNIAKTFQSLQDVMVAVMQEGGRRRVKTEEETAAQQAATQQRAADKAAGIAERLAARQTEIAEKAAAAVAAANARVATASEQASSALQKMGQAGMALMGVKVVVDTLVASFHGISEALVGSNAKLENMNIGLSAVVNGMLRIKDATGQTLEGQEKFNAAQEISSKLINQFRVDQIKTVNTSQELVETATTISSMVLGAGRNMEDLRKMTLLTSTAAAALQIPLKTAAYEVNELLAGRALITSPLYQRLNLTSQQLETIKHGGKAAFDALSEAMAKFQMAATAHQASWVGITSAIRDAYQVITQMAGKELFEGLKKEVAALADVIFPTINGIQQFNPVIEEVAKNIGHNLAGAFQMVLSVVKPVGEAVFGLTAFLYEHGTAVKAAAVAMVAYAATLAVASTIAAVTAYLQTFTTVIFAYNAVVGGAATITEAFNLVLMSSPLVAAAVAVGALAAAFYLLSGNVTDTAVALNAATAKMLADNKANIDGAEAKKANWIESQKLIDRHNELAKKTQLTKDEHAELKRIIGELVALHPAHAAALKGITEHTQIQGQAVQNLKTDWENAAAAAFRYANMTERVARANKNTVRDQLAEAKSQLHQPGGADGGGGFHGYGVGRSAAASGAQLAVIDTLQKQYNLLKTKHEQAEAMQGAAELTKDIGYKPGHVTTGPANQHGLHDSGLKGRMGEITRADAAAGHTTESMNKAKAAIAELGKEYNLTEDQINKTVIAVHKLEKAHDAIGKKAEAAAKRAGSKALAAFHKAEAAAKKHDRATFGADFSGITTHGSGDRKGLGKDDTGGRIKSIDTEIAQLTELATARNLDIGQRSRVAAKITALEGERAKDIVVEGEKYLAAEKKLADDIDILEGDSVEKRRVKTRAGYDALIKEFETHKAVLVASHTATAAQLSAVDDDIAKAKGAKLAAIAKIDADHEAKMLEEREKAEGTWTVILEKIETTRDGLADNHYAHQRAALAAQYEHEIKAAEAAGKKLSEVLISQLADANNAPKKDDTLIASLTAQLKALQPEIAARVTELGRLKEVATTAFDAAKDKTEKDKETQANVAMFDSFIKGAKDAQTAIEHLTDANVPLIKKLEDVGRVALDAFKKPIADALAPLLQKISDVITKVADAAAGFITMGIQAAGSWIIAMGPIGWAVAAIGVVTVAITALVLTIQDAAEKAAAMASAFVNKIPEATAKVWALQDAAKGIGDATKAGVITANQGLDLYIAKLKTAKQAYIDAIVKPGGSPEETAKDVQTYRKIMLSDQKFANYYRTNFHKSADDLADMDDDGLASIAAQMAAGLGVDLRKPADKITDGDRQSGGTPYAFLQAYDRNRGAKASLSALGRTQTELDKAEQDKAEGAISQAQDLKGVVSEDDYKAKMKSAVASVKAFWQGIYETQPQRREEAAASLKWLADNFREFDQKLIDDIAKRDAELKKMGTLHLGKDNEADDWNTGKHVDANGDTVVVRQNAAGEAISRQQQRANELAAEKEAHDRRTGQLADERLATEKSIALITATQDRVTGHIYLTTEQLVTLRKELNTDEILAQKEIAGILNEGIAQRELSVTQDKINRIRELQFKGSEQLKVHTDRLTQIGRESAAEDQAYQTKNLNIENTFNRENAAHDRRMINLQAEIDKQQIALDLINKQVAARDLQSKTNFNGASGNAVFGNQGSAGSYTTEGKDYAAAHGIRLFKDGGDVHGTGPAIVHDGETVANPGETSTIRRLIPLLQGLFGAGSTQGPWGGRPPAPPSHAGAVLNLTIDMSGATLTAADPQALLGQVSQQITHAMEHAMPGLRLFTN